MKKKICYSYSKALENILNEYQRLKLNHIEVYTINALQDEVHSVWSSEEKAAQYLCNNHPGDDFRLYNIISADAILDDIITELPDPLSTGNLLTTYNKLLIRNVLYFYHNLGHKTLIVTIGTSQNNLFIAQNYSYFVGLAQKIAQQYDQLMKPENKIIARYTIHTHRPNYLSQQQRVILTYIVSGLMNKEISDLTQLSTRTVEKHVSNICKKLNVKNRNQLISQYYFYQNHPKIILK